MTQLWRKRALVMVAALCVVTASGVSLAEEGDSKPKPRVELSMRSWMFTNGETTWSHNASGSYPAFGNPTSKLTYKDNNTHILEFGAKLNFSKGWFVRGEVGFSVDFDRGTLVDDDYSAVGGQHLFSRTNSDITGDGTWYLNLEGGRRIVEYSGNRGYLDFFGGLQYWNTKYEARTVRQVECAPSGIPGISCNPAGTVSSQGQLAIVNTTHWITPIRIGAQTEYRFAHWVSVEGKLAVSPISLMYNEDRHVLRADLQQPSFTMWGAGASANADAGVKIMLTKNVALTGGYRVWWNAIYSGTLETHPVGFSSETFPMREFQTLRHGPTVGLTASF